MLPRCLFWLAVTFWSSTIFITWFIVVPKQSHVSSSALGRLTSAHLTYFFLDSWLLKMGPIGCPETSIRSNSPEGRSFRLLCGGSWKNLTLRIVWYGMFLDQSGIFVRVDSFRRLTNYVSNLRRTHFFISAKCEKKKGTSKIRSIEVFHSSHMAWIKPIQYKRK